MTGGTVPLAATLATNAVFDSFIGDSKVIYYGVLSCMRNTKFILQLDLIAYLILHLLRYVKLFTLSSNLNTQIDVV